MARHSILFNQRHSCSVREAISEKTIHRYVIKTPSLVPQSLHTCASTFSHTLSINFNTFFYQVTHFSMNSKCLVFFQFIWQTQQLFSKLNKNRKGKNNPTLWDSNSAVQRFPEENSFSLEYGHNFVKPEFHCPNINLNKVKSSENRKGNLNYVEWYVHFFSETYGLVNCTSFSQIASSNI